MKKSSQEGPYSDFFRINDQTKQCDESTKTGYLMTVTATCQLLSERQS